ncbi:MAG TPA: radical SAM family heme chaperone HemW [Aggregatilineales bacterium]|nr:radical SAM family heme chaperone HemW [Aggregatilineales bacterium]
MGSSGLSLYVHIPFCRTLCTYCAFNTYAGMQALVAPYVEALCREIRLVGEAGGAAAHTLYFGGGTPSLLSAEQAAAVIEAAREVFALPDGAEITLEANPGTVDLDKLRAYRAGGVNRLSIGVQSADADELRMFGRRHSFEEAEEAYRLARAAGCDNISLDLIYGAPRQTLAGWRRTLDAVLAWEPEHVSLYALKLEPGTSLHRQVERGRLPEPDDDLAADMYDLARACLDAAGLQQYEISNWARPGFESVHNRQYWLNEPYLGFGAGAHGYAAGLRYWNVDPVAEYIGLIKQGEPRAFPLSPAVADTETISTTLEMAETVILGLRLVGEGVSRRAFEARFGRSLDDVFGAALGAMVQAGLVMQDGDRVRLTERGYLLSNQVFMRLLPEEA